MVEILAAQGNVHAARRLEELWNELAMRLSFTLLGGCSAAHFASDRTRETLALICDTHTHIQLGKGGFLEQRLAKHREPCLETLPNAVA